MSRPSRSSKRGKGDAVPESRELDMCNHRGDQVIEHLAALGDLALAKAAYRVELLRRHI